MLRRVLRLLSGNLLHLSRCRRRVLRLTWLAGVRRLDWLAWNLRLNRLTGNRDLAGILELAGILRLLARQRLWLPRIAGGLSGLRRILRLAGLNWLSGISGLPGISRLSRVDGLRRIPRLTGRKRLARLCLPGHWILRLLRVLWLLLAGILESRLCGSSRRNTVARPTQRHV